MCRTYRMRVNVKPRHANARPYKRGEKHRNTNYEN